MVVRMQGTFRRDHRENNGIEAIAEQLTDGILRRFFAVGVIEPIRVIEDIQDGGSRDVVVRWTYVEVADGQDAKDLEKMLNRIREIRLGRPMSGTLFDNMEPGSGEPTGD